MREDSHIEADIKENVSRPPPPYWQTPVTFLIHSMVGTTIFVIVAVPAILINLAVKALDKYSIDSIIIYGLITVEYAVFITDLFLFLVFLWRTARRTLRDL